MPNSYAEVLRDRFREAKKEFEDAKKESIAAIEKMDWLKASNYGAAYASYVDKISIAAGKLHQVSFLIRTYNAMYPEDLVDMES